tara:strand:- start:204 stop:383 length:180 start_codon:yes stop_codon:yes gene_type:complete
MKILNKNIAGIDCILTCSKTETKLISKKHITTRWSIKEVGDSVGISLLGAEAVRRYISA